MDERFDCFALFGAHQHVVATRWGVAEANMDNQPFKRSERQIDC